MDIEQHDTEPVDRELLDEVARLRDQVTAIRAVVGDDQHRARCDAAAAALRQLLESADRQSGACEPGPVTQLGDELSAILCELEGGDR